MKYGQASSLTAYMTPYENDRITHSLPKAGKEQISTCVETVSFLLKFYATDSDSSKATSKLSVLRKTTVVPSRQFPDVLRTKIARC